MIKAIIFDVGGVLIRTVDQTTRMKLAKEYNLTYSEIIEVVFGISSDHNPQLGQISWDDHLANISKKLEISPEEGEDFMELFFAGDQLNMELVDAIRMYKQDYKIGILSNAMTNLEDLMKNDWKIINLFDAVINSSVEGVMKPDGKLYEIALEKLGVLPEEAVFIDDMPVNIDAANELGIHGIRYVDNQQTLKEINTILKEE
jgi:epoxide hydrolase-like predicted phosphatase